MSQLAKSGRKRRALSEAREFGRLVELARGSRGKVDAAIDDVCRRNPKRWGKKRNGYNLWAAYKADRRRQAELDARQRKLDAAEKVILRALAPTAAESALLRAAERSTEDTKRLRDILCTRTRKKLQ